MPTTGHQWFLEPFSDLRGRNRCPKSRRAGPWRCCDLPEVLPHCFLGLRETFLAVRVREREVVRIQAMCLSIRPLRDPALTIRGRFSPVSNKSADTTDGEQCRCDERFSYRIGRRLTSSLSDRCYKRHTPLLSFTSQTSPSLRSNRYSWTTNRPRVGRSSSSRLHMHRPRGL